MNADILAHILKDCEFYRMQHYEPDNILGINDYAAFLAWNALCISELSNEDVAGLEQVCKLIKNETLKMMDMEECREWHASGIYFNSKKELVIVHPR